MKPKSHELVGTPIHTFNELIMAANFEDVEEAVRFISGRPDLYEFAQRFSGWLVELHDERQLLARVNSELARREIELALS